MDIELPTAKSRYGFGSSLSTKTANRTNARNKAEGKRTPIRTGKARSPRTSESKKLKLHKSKNYSLGDDSVMGGKITPAESTSWLSDLTPEQIANVLFPPSIDGLFAIWEATNFPRANGDEQHKKLREFFDSVAGKYGKLLSSVSYGGGKEELIYALESSPAFMWAIQTFGSPAFVAFSEKSGPPAVYDASFNFIAINTSNDVMNRSDSSYVPPKDSDIIDNSTNSAIVHEWSHWLHNMCIRDTEFLGNQNSKIKNFFGSTGSRKYAKALSIAEKYDTLDKTEFHGDGTRSFSGGPAINSYFGHINGREMLSEAVVAYMHPNNALAFTAMNDELRADVESFLMIGNSSRPWVSGVEK